MTEPLKHIALAWKVDHPSEPLDIATVQSHYNILLGLAASCDKYVWQKLEDLTVVFEDLGYTRSIAVELHDKTSQNSLSPSACRIAQKLKVLQDNANPSKEEIHEMYNSMKHLINTVTLASAKSWNAACEDEPMSENAPAEPHTGL